MINHLNTTILILDVWILLAIAGVLIYLWVKK